MGAVAGMAVGVGMDAVAGIDAGMGGGVDMDPGAGEGVRPPVSRDAWAKARQIPSPADGPLGGLWRGAWDLPAR